MANQTDYEAVEPTRDTVDRIEGPVVVEFGSPWCGHCRLAKPLVESALKDHPEVRHIRIEDGSGRRLGRSFKVKLWPTLVFMKAGKEAGRLVRPRDEKPIREALAGIAPAAGTASQSA